MKLKYFIKPLIWLGLICYGLFIPVNKLPAKPLINLPYFDKMVHFGLFFVLCLLLFRPAKRSGFRPLIFAPSVSLFLAALLEMTQHLLSSTRSSNMYDFLANAAGIFTSVIVYHYVISGKRWERFI